MARRYRHGNDPGHHEAAWLAPGHQRGYDDNAGTLYDEAVGPGPTSRPTRWVMRRAVNEWDDPVIDGIILKLDALATVEATRARVVAKSYRPDYRVYEEEIVGHEHWLDARHAAARIGVTTSTLFNMRHRGTGPLSSLFGARVRWEPQSVEAFAARRNGRARQDVRNQPPADQLVVRTTRVGPTYWTGVRWTPDINHARHYRSAGMAQRIAEGLRATTTAAPQSGDADRAQTPTEDA